MTAALALGGCGLTDLVTLSAYFLKVVAAATPEEVGVHFRHGAEPTQRVDEILELIRKASEVLALRLLEGCLLCTLEALASDRKVALDIRATEILFGGGSAISASEERFLAEFGSRTGVAFLLGARSRARLRAAGSHRCGATAVIAALVFVIVFLVLIEVRVKDCVDAVVLVQ